MSQISCKRCPISFPNAIVYFVLSGPFIRCLYSWCFPVSGDIAAFIRPVWIVTSPFILLVCAQPSPDFFTEYAWINLLGGLVGWTVSVSFAIRSWTFILLDLVFYICTGGMLPDFSLYGCVSGARASVSYGMTWGIV